MNDEKKQIELLTHIADTLCNLANNASSQKTINDIEFMANGIFKEHAQYAEAVHRSASKQRKKITGDILRQALKKFKK